MNHVVANRPSSILAQTRQRQNQASQHLPHLCPLPRQGVLLDKKQLKAAADAALNPPKPAPAAPKPALAAVAAGTAAAAPVAGVLGFLTGLCHYTPLV